MWCSYRCLYSLQLMKIFIILLAAAGKEVQICIFPANQGGTNRACHPGPVPTTPFPFCVPGRGSSALRAQSLSLPPLRHNRKGKERPGGPACLYTLRFTPQKGCPSVSLPCSPSSRLPALCPVWTARALCPLRLEQACVCIKCVLPKGLSRSFRPSEGPLGSVLSSLWFPVRGTWGEGVTDPLPRGH